MYVYIHINTHARTGTHTHTHTYFFALQGYALSVGFSYSLVKYDEVGNGDDNESESAMTRRVIALMR